MSQTEKKKRKLLKNISKQKKFTSKYKNYIVPSKFIPKTDEQMKENQPNEPTNESNEQEFEQIHIPDFYTKWPERMKNSDVSDAVKAELIDIVKSTGVEDDKMVSKVVDLAYSAVHDYIGVLYVEGGARPKTRAAVEACFESADQALRISDLELNIVDRFVTAQKITNVMFKNYSPVAFADNKLDYYCDDYVLRDDEILTRQLNDYKIKQEEIDQLKKDIIATLEGHTVQRKEPAKEEPPKEEPPKEEPAKEEPAKEEPQPVNSEARVAV